MSLTVYILTTSTHGIHIEKLNTFLRIVETVLVSYLKTGHDSIYVFLRYTFYNVIDHVTISLFYATDTSFVRILPCVDNKPFKRCKIIVVAYWSNVETRTGAAI